MRFVSVARQAPRACELTLCPVDCSEKGVIEPFEELWGTKELIVSYDAMYVRFSLSFSSGSISCICHPRITLDALRILGLTPLFN